MRIGIKMAIRIRIGIKTMTIHNTVMKKQLKFLKRDFQKTMNIESESKSWEISGRDMISYLAIPFMQTYTSLWILKISRIYSKIYRLAYGFLFFVISISANFTGVLPCCAMTLFYACRLEHASE